MCEGKKRITVGQLTQAINKTRKDLKAGERFIRSAQHWIHTHTRAGAETAGKKGKKDAKG